MPSIQELLIILFVAALLFSSKVPQFTRNLGRSLFLTKKGFKETQEELKALEEKQKKNSNS
ncbi:MAG: twin-arginine translocase TatA/TatE family subunit [Planctomycetota bacterium]